MRIAFVLMLLTSTAYAQEKTYTLTVTSQELTIIGDGLAQLPYKTSVAIIQKLNAQIKEQGQEAPKPQVEQNVKPK